MQRGSAGECVFDLSAKMRLRVLSQRAEVCVRISIDAKLRDAMLEAGKKFVVDGSFNIDTLDCNAHATRIGKGAVSDTFNGSV